LIKVSKRKDENTQAPENRGPSDEPPKENGDFPKNGSNNFY
jgi:hypothetical protein